jgi:methylated-DNA-[protein]-cysteine S-methyltransferase
MPRILVAGGTKTAPVSRAARLFPSQLGWIALAAEGETVLRLTFGHTSETAARRAIAAWRIPWVADFRRGELLQVDGPWAALVTRLQSFATGARDEFHDVQVAPRSTPFQQQVLEACRAVGYGQRASYGDLARRAGRPGAARAVGQVMATNQVPLIVPCHRIVASGGALGGYSAASGVTLKQRLLDLETRQAKRSFAS